MGSESCERDGTREPARGREIPMPIAIEVPRVKMSDISCFGLFRDEPFALELLQSSRKCLLKTSIDKPRDLIEGG